MKALSGMIFIILAAFCAIAAEKRTYPCHRLAQAPQIDGKIDEAAWKNIPEATGFYILGGSEEYSQYALEKQTFFRAGWTEDAVYIIVRAEENAPDKMIAKAEGGKTVWAGDCIELFFFPNAAVTYVQLAVNCAGLMWSDKHDQPGAWEAKALTDKTQWILELRIPFAALAEKPPQEGEQWLVNIARNMPSEPAKERTTSWPRLEKSKGFHDVKHFACFIFMGSAGNESATEEAELRRQYDQYLNGRLRKLATLAGEYERAFDEAQTPVAVGGEGDQLRQTWKQIAELAAQTHPDMLKTRAMCRAGIDLQKKSDDFIGRRMLDKLFTN